ncbi:MAG: PDZ domain-containing protein [Desulfobulbaceae bacterium]|nr:PDZ domain-containing protein [Desulfobulbaceae bacterium]
MKHFIMVIAISIFCFMAHVVDAYDFYGASVSDRDVPSSYMKYGLKGLIGYRPTITGISYDSTADKAGFKRGDIFLSINDKVVKSTSDLGQFTGPTISVNLFRGLERMTLTIDRLAIEAEKASRIAGEKKSPEDERKTGNSAPPSFDGAVLGKKMLKPLPAGLASKKQPTETDRKIEEIDKKNEKTSLEKKKYEWDIVSFTHFPNLVENVVLRGDMVNL